MDLLRPTNIEEVPSVLGINELREVHANFGNNRNIASGPDEKENRVKNRVSSEIRTRQSFRRSKSHWRKHLNWISRYFLRNLIHVDTIALQSFDFKVKHKLGELNIVPDTLFSWFIFEQREKNQTVTHTNTQDWTGGPYLAKKHTLYPYRLYDRKSDKLESATSDREPFSVKAIHVSTTHILTPVDHEKIREE